MITLILATDMARHAEIMDSFKEKMEDFDYSNEEHLTLVRAGALGGAGEGPRPPAQTGTQAASPCGWWQESRFAKSQLLGEAPPPPAMGPQFLDSSTVLGFEGESGGQQPSVQSSG